MFFLCIIMIVCYLLMATELERTIYFNKKLNLLDCMNFYIFLMIAKATYV
jgi:hypothetical protein